MSPSSKPARRFFVALASAAGVAGLVALFCCGPGTKPAETAKDSKEPATPSGAASAATSPDAPPAAVPGDAPAAPRPRSDTDGPLVPLEDAGAPARNPIAAAVARDPRDLELLAQIERELRRDPPPVVHALLALRERGATRSELVAFVRERFPQDLPLRAAALRWVDRVAPPVSGERSTPNPGASGPPLVRPLEKAP